MEVELTVTSVTTIQQHFHILDGIYRYFGQIIWLEYTDVLAGIYRYFGQNIQMFWLEYTDILDGIYR